ncbi:MAG: hypothetical protein EOP53_22780 [Sphingobacteriales bacterium]|nr:MAG: hypothetical protein EOP53_22780 [Sphingobacteriales bacterium]
MQANSIPEVLQVLDQIISECKAKNSRLGYFAVLYRMMTAAVAEGMKKNFFDDTARMEKLDVVFANRYLQAYFDYKDGKRVTQSWKMAFDAAQQDDLIVVQHLLLGINAHINLDLGIAAADICSNENIRELQHDFVKINDTIADVYSVLQPRFTKISWPAIFLSKLNPRAVNNTINFSIVKAREVAWANALILCNAGNNNREEIIRHTDNIVLKVGNAVKNPSSLKNMALKIIHLFENKNIAANITTLGSQ